MALILIISLAYLLTSTGEGDGVLQASGTVEATEIQIAPDMPGRVAAVLVDEGKKVEAGQALLRLDDQLLQAQLQRAQAALEAARAGEAAARAALRASLAAQAQAERALELARLKHEMALRAARSQEQPARQRAWRQPQPALFELPPWYFQKSETLDAARQEVARALEELEAARQALYDPLDPDERAELAQAEGDLAGARNALLIARQVRDMARLSGDPDLQDQADERYNQAEQALQDAQEAYDQVLEAVERQEVTAARARLAVDQAWYDAARDRLAALETGEESLQVKAAWLGVEQAQSALDLARLQVEQARAGLLQAQTGVSQAEAEIQALELQLGKLVLYAPRAGVILSRNVEPGEFLQVGTAALVLADLSQLTITVYLPEDRYGQVKLGDRVEISVDSFPGEAFRGDVVRIAERAEFAPRNVQTETGRRTTVYAIEIAVHDPEGKLKPGMPADVAFLGLQR
jgi:HlyD family secretion protein